MAEPNPTPTPNEPTPAPQGTPQENAPAFDYDKLASLITGKQSAWLSAKRIKSGGSPDPL